MPHNTAQPAKVLLTCGICGRAFSCKYETLERRRQKGQWNPYCGPRCTNSALERYGRRPPGSHLVEEMLLSPKRQAPDPPFPPELASQQGVPVYAVCAWCGTNLEVDAVTQQRNDSRQDVYCAVCRQSASHEAPRQETDGVAQPKGVAATLATLTCSECGTAFTRKEALVRSQQKRGCRRFFCSPGCAARRRPPQDAFEETTRVCDECGESFSLLRSRAEGNERKGRPLYCSDCALANRRSSQGKTLKATARDLAPCPPGKKGKATLKGRPRRAAATKATSRRQHNPSAETSAQVTLPCEQCGQSFTEPRSQSEWRQRNGKQLVCRRQRCNILAYRQERLQREGRRTDAWAALACDQCRQKFMRERAFAEEWYLKGNDIILCERCVGGLDSPQKQQREMDHLAMEFRQPTRAQHGHSTGRPSRGSAPVSSPQPGRYSHYKLEWLPLTCPECGRTFERSRPEVERQRRLDRVIYCYKSCATRAKQKEKLQRQGPLP